MEPTEEQEECSSQQFSDIQNYLSTFNKDIGGGTSSGVLVGENNEEGTVGIFSISGQDNSDVTESINNNNSIIVEQDSLFPHNDPIEDKTDIVSHYQVDSTDATLDLAGAEISQVTLPNDIIIKSDDIVDISSLGNLTMVHDQLAQLNGKVLTSQDMDGKPITLRFGIDGDIIGEVTDSNQLQQLNQQVLSVTIPNTQQATETQQSKMYLQQMNSDPVSVLASIATNTAVVNESIQAQRKDGGGTSGLRPIAMKPAIVDGAQLVAIQNSNDSSQPQLVAMQKGTTIGSDSHIQLTEKGGAITIMTPEGQSSDNVNYVFIVQDGNDREQLKQLAGDTGVFSNNEFKTEEIIDEQGNVKKVLAIEADKIIGHLPSAQLELMCDRCNYTSPKRYLLTRHLKTHSEDRPHRCDFCSRGFKTVGALQNHVNTHTGVRPHKCKDCDAAFTTSGELVRHIRYRHTFEKPHKCDQCDYASVELSKLKRHIRSHTGERPYCCPHCTYASPDTYKLKRHLRIHTGEKPYECDICHTRFTQSNSLKAHKLIHSGNKPVYQCELCPTTCGRRTDLKIHMQKLHMSDKPIECKKCNTEFPDRYHYKVHVKTHEGEKCYRCEHCEYAALSIRNLEQHSLIHNLSKPYTCDMCPATFLQRQLVKRHKAIHHSFVAVPSKQFVDKVVDDVIITDAENENQTEGSEKEFDFNNQLLHSSLLSDLRKGKLGNAPQVVIVHPDGRVEEVTEKLQAEALGQTSKLDISETEQSISQAADESDASEEEEEEDDIDSQDVQDQNESSIACQVEFDESDEEHVKHVKTEHIGDVTLQERVSDTRISMAVEETVKEHERIQEISCGVSTDDSEVLVLGVPQSISSLADSVNNENETSATGQTTVPVNFLQDLSSHMGVSNNILQLLTTQDGGSIQVLHLDASTAAQLTEQPAVKKIRLGPN